MDWAARVYDAYYNAAAAPTDASREVFFVSLAHARSSPAWCAGQLIDFLVFHFDTVEDLANSARGMPHLWRGLMVVRELEAARRAVCADMNSKLTAVHLIGRH